MLAVSQMVSAIAATRTENMGYRIYAHAMLRRRFMVTM